MPAATAAEPRRVSNNGGIAPAANPRQAPHVPDPGADVAEFRAIIGKTSDGQSADGGGQAMHLIIVLCDSSKSGSLNIPLTHDRPSLQMLLSRK